MLVITLNDVHSHLQTMGITVESSGWMEQLSTKLQGYISYNGWDYANQQDVLNIMCQSGTVVPSNITDFGTVVNTYDDSVG